MSGECEKCSEHCLDCLCKPLRKPLESEYSIDSLIDTFERHSKEYEEMHKDQIINKDFNICKAFLTFAIEIKKLKDK